MTMKRPPVLPSLFAVLATSLAFACGGSSDESDSTPGGSSAGTSAAGAGGKGASAGAPSAGHSGATGGSPTAGTGGAAGDGGSTPGAGYGGAAGDGGSTPGAGTGGAAGDGGSTPGAGNGGAAGDGGSTPGAGNGGAAGDGGSTPGAGNGGSAGDGGSAQGGAGNGGAGGGSSLCCKISSDCGDPANFDCVQGTCEKHVDPPACWFDTGCGKGEICIGANVCPCGVNCLLPDSPGKCVPNTATACCKIDKDCKGGVCVNGTCTPDIPTPPKCYRDLECNKGQHCIGENVCKCDPGSPTLCGKILAGICADGNCCASNADCNDKSECVPGKNTKTGVCKELPQADTCWMDSDCKGPKEKCMGAEVCACGSKCFAPDKPGKCLVAD